MESKADDAWIMEGMEVGGGNCLKILGGKLPGLVLVFAVVCLTLLGITVLSSVTSSQGTEWPNLFRRQLIWLALALLAGGFVAFLNLDRMRPLAWPLAVLTGLLLLLVLVPGVGVMANGARRWLDLGPINFQVSDFAKLGLVFVLAHYLAANQRNLRRFISGFAIPSAMICSVSFLILLEPDFGTALLVAAVGFALLFLCGARLLFLIPTVLLGGLFFAIAVYLDPMRWKRVTAFMDVDANKEDGAYQLWQGMLAFGAGGTYGVGLGNGRQQMSYLPEAHTDFIFPIIGEEMGIIVSGGVVILFMVIYITGVWHVGRAPNLFQFLLVVGSLLVITTQAIVNLCVVTGCLPTKGMSLPFISYGGSSLVTMFVLVGLMLNCFREWDRSPLGNPVEL